MKKPKPRLRDRPTQGAVPGSIIVPERLDVETETPESHCPTCSNRITVASGDTVPEGGDYTLCAYCGELAVFEEDRKLRLPTGEEVERFLSEPEAARMQAIAVRLATERGTRR